MVAIDDELTMEWRTEWVWTTICGVLLGILMARLAASRLPRPSRADISPVSAAPTTPLLPGGMPKLTMSLPIPEVEEAGEVRLRHDAHSILVFSGGTAFNKYVRTLARQIEDVTYVLPVSDNGGSTAEILRVLGGPAIGDIRSRLLRLSSAKTDEACSVLHLLQYRLPMIRNNARVEWNAIVAGSHYLWTKSISHSYKQMIRTFLIHFHYEVLKQDRGTFNYTNGSIGNFFFTGARMFFDSLEAAIFLWSRLAGIPLRSAVLPVINTNRKVTIVAQLDDALGTTLHGQQRISHPANAAEDTHMGASEEEESLHERRTIVDKSGSGQQLIGVRIRYVSSFLPSPTPPLSSRFFFFFF